VAGHREVFFKSQRPLFVQILATEAGIKAIMEITFGHHHVAVVATSASFYQLLEYLDKDLF
jgi:hypothetical protein